MKEIKVLLLKIYPDIFGGNINSIKSIVEGKISEIDDKMAEPESTKNLMLKVKASLLSEVKGCGGDMEELLKRKGLTV
jgi:hypothetical protein